MYGYTKLFQSIITSTVWQEPNDCKVLWIALLALKDKDHVCRATIPALSKLCNLTIEDTQRYLKKFQDPDPFSRSKENEGRRIEPHEEGWLILNGPKYAAKLSYLDQLERTNERVRRYRQRHKCNVSVTESNAVTLSDTDQIQIKSDTEKSNTSKPKKARVQKTELSPEGNWLNLGEEKINTWIKAYPGIHVKEELVRAAAWALSNPNRKKSNWNRFLNNWLMSAQDHVRGNVVINNLPRKGMFD